MGWLNSVLTKTAKPVARSGTTISYYSTTI